MKKILLALVFGLIALGFAQAQDATHDKAYIKNGLAIGPNVSGSINFDFNPLIFMEQNIGIYFDDTSTDATHPANDWRISINETGINGKNFFRIDDITSSLSPFTIMAGSRNHALTTNGSFVGLGTEAPAKELHILGYNSPTIRLEQTSTDYGLCSWDLSANERSFYIRDVNSGSIPFMVGPNQQSYFFRIMDNKVGIGIPSGFSGSLGPIEATLHVNGHMRLEPQDAAPATPGLGDLYFDKTSSQYKFYEGTNWLALEPNTDSQELSISSDVLSLSGGTNTIDLSSYLDNTDTQNIALSGTALSIDNGNSVDLSILKDGYEANTDAQNIALSGTNLSIDNGNSVDLSALKDGYEANSDSQELDLFTNVLSISGGTKTVNLSSYLDNTDAQTLGLTGNSLSVLNGNSIDLSAYLDNTDAQNISFSGTALSIANGNSVDLSTLKDGYEANTDSQNIALSGTNLSIANGNTVDLSTLQDGYEVNTDKQELDLSLNDLSISGGIKTVDLSGYLDNTDSQNITLSGTALSIANGNSVDLSTLKDGYEANTDSQELDLFTNVLSISGGTKTINLSNYLDNTDSQTLSLSGNSLSVLNGNSVDLSALKDGYEANTDAQSLSLSGTDLSISGGNTIDLSSVAVEGADNQELNLFGTSLSIENGNSVDLSSLLKSIYDRLDEQESKIAEQENTIAQLETEISELKSFHTNETNDSKTQSGGILYQNYPNPTNGITHINYFLPETISNSRLLIYDINGRIHKNIPLNNRGKGSIEINGTEFDSGQYIYTLLTDGSRIDSKKMIIVK